MRSWFALKWAMLVLFACITQGKVVMQDVWDYAPYTKLFVSNFNAFSSVLDWRLHGWQIPKHQLARTQDARALYFRERAEYRAHKYLQSATKWSGLPRIVHAY